MNTNLSTDAATVRLLTTQALLTYHADTIAKMAAQGIHPPIPTIDVIIKQAEQVTTFILGVNDATALAYETVRTAAQSLFGLVHDFDIKTANSEGRAEVLRALDVLAAELHGILQGQPRQ